MTTEIHTLATTSAEPPKRRLVTHEQARSYLGGIGRGTLYLLRREGEITFVKISGRSFVDQLSLDAYIDRQIAKAECG